MPHFKYILVGGGMTGASAVKGIRKNDPNGTIAMFTTEPDPPYLRPPLTKTLWTGKKKLSDIWFNVQDQGVEVFVDHPVEKIEPSNHAVVDREGNSYTYDRLLLATGGSPRRLPFGGDDILYFRTLKDYQYLQQKVEANDRFAVIGGGFIGSEIAAALAMKGQKVTIVFPEKGITARVLPEDLSAFVVDTFRRKGVDVRNEESIDGFELQGQDRVLKTRSSGNISAGTVIAGLGIRPNIELAQAAGLDTGDGIVVGRNLCTSHPDIYAAGDVASFYSPDLQTRRRVEHEDNALAMGEHAGRNMSGENANYDYMPLFYSDLFELGYEAVGELNSELETYADWEERFEKGVIYYLKEGRVRGALLWNVWGQVDEARRLIAEPGPFTKQDLKGRIAG